MTSRLPLLANTLWVLSALPEALAYRWAAGRPEESQTALLLQILRANQESALGRHWRFNQIHSVGQFQERLPITTYADLLPWIQRIEAGEAGVLTHDPVRLLEPTSGSTSATKLIPYTDGLKRDFQRGIAPWIVDTFLRTPQLFGGTAYWSVTPVLDRQRVSVGGIPIGFEEESEYLGSWAGRLVNSVLAVPGGVKLIPDLVAFRYVTLYFLLRSRQLALISVWNPTFFLLLLDSLLAWWPQLLQDVARGSLSPPGLSAPLPTAVTAGVRPDPVRGRELAAFWDPERGPLTEEARSRLHARIWPRLRLLSCWADGNAAPFARQLAALLPQARLQPKGLLATEAFVTLPLGDGVGAPLAVRSHFFEFADRAAPHSQPKLAHELTLGGIYDVIVTTGGGLTRYALQDRVQVTGWYGRLPRLRFLGRAAAVSDWFGEKVNEGHVQSILDGVLPHYALQPDFLMIALDDGMTEPAYTLYIQCRNGSDPTLLRLGADLEIGLLENVHYAYCRRLGQLAPVHVFRIRDGALADFLQSSMARGQRAGDVKPTFLHRQGGWSAVFDGYRVTLP